MLDSSDRVIVAGASGLIGRALVASLRAQGVTVDKLVRRTAVRDDEIQWDPTRSLAPDALAGARAIVVLNGASIGRLPWTTSYRTELLWSRLSPVRAAAAAVAQLGSDAPQLVHASAVGFYGNQPRGPVDESSAAGTGFLADLCVDIESAARRASGTTAVTSLRIAPVIHPDGVLKPLMSLTRWGAGGKLGRGNQSWPWISLPDTVRAIEHTIAHGVDGPVNVTGPTRATATDIGFALAVAMNRPFLVPAPAFALRAALGLAAESLLLSDVEARPRVLTETGFTWDHPTAEQAIQVALTDAALTRPSAMP